MKKQIEIASEVNNSSSASKLASVVRENKWGLAMLILLLFVVSVGLGLSSCGQSATAQTGGIVDNSGKIPDGTYVNTESGEKPGDFYITISGKKIVSGRVGDSGSSSEANYIIKDGDFIRYRDKDARIVKYILDGDKLIIFDEFYTSTNSSRNFGRVYTKK